MHVDLIDHLRCPRVHEETPLVASVDRVVGRDVEEGSLGCPACLARYPIRGFVADFTQGPSVPWSPAAALPVDDDAIVRAAAMLDARVPGSWHLLFGAWGRVAAALVVSFDVRCVLLNPLPGAPLADGASIIQVTHRLPFAETWASGAALDRAAALLPPLVERAVHALRAGARLVAPAASPLPPELRELARDETWWVAERDTSAGPPIPLRRVNR